MLSGSEEPSRPQCEPLYSLLPESLEQLSAMRPPGTEGGIGRKSAVRTRIELRNGLKFGACLLSYNTPQTTFEP